MTPWRDDRTMTTTDDTITATDYYAKCHACGREWATEADTTARTFVSHELREHDGAQTIWTRTDELEAMRPTRAKPERRLATSHQAMTPARSTYAAEGVTEATDDLPAPGSAWAEAMAAEARSTEPRGAWGERFEYEGDGFDPCIEGDDEGDQ